MSFKSALRNTQINQRYRQQALQDYALQNKRADDAKEFNAKENTRNNLVGLATDSVNLLGSMGGSLSNFSKNIKFAGDNDLDFSFMDALKGKGGFSGEGIPNMSLNQLGKTRGLMDYNQAIGGNEIPLADAAAISTSMNPYQGLMSYAQKAMGATTNQTQADAPKIEEKIQAPIKPAVSQQNTISNMLNDEEQEKYNELFQQGSYSMPPFMQWFQGGSE